MANILQTIFFFYLSFLIAFVGLEFGVKIIEVSGFECGTVDLTVPLVKGGQQTKKGEWPFLAALFKLEKYFCGGTVVSNKHVLTAAHCIQQKYSATKLSPVDIVVLLGAYDLTMETEIGAVKKNVSEIHVHPDWNVTSDKYDADLAILRLSGEVVFTNYIRPVCMPDDNAVVDGAMGSVVGWGLADGTEAQKKFPLHAATNALDNLYCLTTDYIIAYISSTRSFCGRGETASPSQGDSGGGFFVRSGSSWVQYGIISALHTNATGYIDVNSIAVYTNVKDFKNWIVGVRQYGLKIILYCDNLRYLFSYSRECNVFDVDIQSDYLDVDFIIESIDYGKNDVEDLTFHNGTMIYLPEVIGNVFQNLKRFSVYAVRLKLLRRSNLKNLPRLEVLSISTNEIEILDEDTLWDLPDLGTFDLTDNLVKMLHERIFEKNTKLRIVILRFNLLEFLPRDLFKNNQELEVIDFQNNLLNIIDADFKNIKLIQLQGNVCIDSVHSGEDRSITEFQRLLIANCSSAVKKPGSKVGETNKVILDCDHRVYIRTMGRSCLIHYVDIRSENLEVAFSANSREFGKSNQYVEQLSIEKGTMLYLPEGIGNFFRYLKTIMVPPLGLKFLRRTNLKNLPRLEELSILTNGIEVLDEDTLWDLPNLVTFQLSDNLVKILYERSFEKNTKLRRVILSGNLLEFLPRDLFKNNEELELINFDDNHLKIIDINFTGFKIIKYILLGANVCINSVHNGKDRNITEFQSLLTANCSSAARKPGSNVGETNEWKVILDCDHQVYLRTMGHECLIDYVDIRRENLEAAFSTASREFGKFAEYVEKLYISEGTMLYLPEGIGKFFKNLKVFWIGEVRLKLIGRSNLKNLVNLEELSIQSNSIEVIDEDTLWDLPNLLRFQLFENKIEILPERTFEKNTKLKDVRISVNQLKFLPRDLFKNNEELESIDFENNLLNNIDINFAGFKNIERIDFQKNVCINSAYSVEERNITEFQSLLTATCSSAVRKPGSKVGETNGLKVILECDHRAYLRTMGCWINYVDIRSENLEVAFSTSSREFGKSNEDVEELYIDEGTMLYLPEGIGKFLQI